jgi:hypothetical protein
MISARGVKALERAGLVVLDIQEYNALVATRDASEYERRFGGLVISGDDQQGYTVTDPSIGRTVAWGQTRTSALQDAERQLSFLRENELPPGGVQP